MMTFNKSVFLPFTTYSLVLYNMDTSDVLSCVIGKRWRSVKSTTSFLEVVQLIGNEFLDEKTYKETNIKKRLKLLQVTKYTNDARDGTR